VPPSRRWQATMARRPEPRAPPTCGSADRVRDSGDVRRSRRRLQRIGKRQAEPGRECRGRGSGVGHRGERSPRIGMVRCAEDGFARGGLEDAAEMISRSSGVKRLRSIGCGEPAVFGGSSAVRRFGSLQEDHIFGFARRLLGGPAQQASWGRCAQMSILVCPRLLDICWTPKQVIILSY
jgi:hypothetical protein